MLQKSLAELAPRTSAFIAGLALLPCVANVRAETLRAPRGLVPTQTHCVYNSAQLQPALDIAASNNKRDVIRINTGPFTADNGFTYSQSESGKFDLTLSGGWTGCTTQTGSPYETTLRRTTPGPILDMEFLSDAHLFVENLSFINGVGEVVGGGSSPGLSGLYVLGFMAELSVTLDRIRLANNMGQNLSVTASGPTRLKNSFIYNNHDSTASMSGDPVYLINNTIAFNTLTTVFDISVGGFNVGCSLPCRAFLANNIFWGNDGADLRIPSSSPMITMLLKNNNIGNLSGIPTENIGQFSEDPGFLIGLPPDLNFHSPMVDQGAKPPTFLPTNPPFEDLWSLGILDFHGDDRVQGARVDIGAAEAFPEIIFLDSYE